uniref:coiled-coil domain-containing protein n=1 Tax=Clostridium perfringens TaxID=1502 RepID=UPI0039E86706
MQITDEKVKKSFVIRALKQIGTFFIFTMIFAIVFSFLQPRVYKTNSEYIFIKEKYDNLQKEYDSLNEKISNDTNALNSKKEDLTKSNEDLQNKLNSLNKEIQSLN